MTSTGIIQTHGLAKRYPTRGAPVTALQNVSLSIKEGQFVSLVGPSGCGKSTLLQILGGLVPASEGDVLVDGTRVSGPMPGKAAIVFQDATLLPWKTAFENIMFPLEVQNVPRAERRTRAEEVLHLVGLADFAAYYPHELSGGMRQRVSIARGLAQHPRIILMDEPFGALDEQNRLKMGHELLRIWEATGKTIFLITHSLTEALYLSDIVLVMSKRPGEIVDVIPVDLPRPRTYELVGGAEFGQARNRIWRQIASGEGAKIERLVEL